MRNFFLAVEEWLFDDSVILFFVKICLLLGIVIAPFYYLSSKKEDTAFQTCMDNGGAWTVTGSHTQHGFIMSGKVMIPTQQNVREYGCVAILKPDKE
jgi:hypothetical protein